MKKFLPIIIGIFVGFAASGAMIVNEIDLVAFGANGDTETPERPVDSNEDVFDLTNEQGNFFEWSDVFSGSDEASDLYSLVYGKLEEMPEQEALTQVASKYGLTVEEANAVVGGSIQPLFNSEYATSRTPLITQEDAYTLLNNAQEDFEDFYEVYELKNEIDAAIAPSTLFSDGDIYNSGFDLIHDLTIMEEILFINSAELSVGGMADNTLDEPFVPTEDEVEESDFIQNQADVATITAVNELREDAEDGDLITDEEGNSGILIGDEIVETEVLVGDVCTIDSPYGDLFEDFDDREEAANLSQGLGSGNGDENSDTDDSPSAEPTPNQQTYEALQPATPAKWGDTWCSGITGDTEKENYEAFGNLGKGLGKVAESGEAFGGLGSSVDSVINDTLVPALNGGSAAGIQEDGFAAHVAICLETELVWKTVSSYQPGDSCIQCEIEKINELMSKTLSHSLVPNKVTGNILESAKCKQSYTALVDIQFITIASPIPTPPNDDLIFGKSIYDEWNSFVERYHPFLGVGASIQADSDDDFQAEFRLNNVPDDVSIADVFVDLKTTRDRLQAEASIGIDSKSASVRGENVKLFYQTVLGEARQMTAFFNHFNDLFKEIDVKACGAILQKECIQ